MRTKRTKTALFSTLLALGMIAGGLVTVTHAQSEDAQLQGASALYPSIPKDQVEPFVPADRITSVASSRSMTAIWETLEHAEASECLACIPSIEGLLYDANPRTREIAAWWLRRRAIGVYGENEVYSRVLSTLKSDADEKRRSYAAEALGEFLAGPGATALGTAIKTDASPVVRAAAARALGRMNLDGAGALAARFSDPDQTVRAAALEAASKVAGFSNPASVVATLGDKDGKVRLKAIQLLDQMKAKDTAGALLGVAQNDPEWNVRGAACHALGSIGDAAARTTLTAIADGDTNVMVRDQARIALRRL